MGFFSKNSNESEYVGGKKHWADVIKNSGSGELLIWRQPEEDFNTNSTLIVMPGEYAIFIKGGNIEQVFESGTYKLSTNNYPFISRLTNAFTGGISTFNCVVYFVRKADSQEIRWGTDSPIQVRDKVWGIRTSAKVRGAYKVRIKNPSLFLEKLIGNNILYHKQEELSKYFHSEFQGIIKSAVTKLLNTIEQEFLGIDSYLDDLSKKIEPFVEEALSDYGLGCVRFSLAAIDIDTSKYDEIDKAQIESISKAKLAQGDKAVMDTLGDRWAIQQNVNILSELAKNNGAAGELGSIGAGLGMGLAAAGGFFNMSNRMQQSQNSVNNQDDPMETLSRLKKMLDAGLIEKEDFDKKKEEILNKL